MRALRPVGWKGEHFWCGPHALSAATGVPIHGVVDILLALRREDPEFGSHHRHRSRSDEKIVGVWSHEIGRFLTSVRIDFTSRILFPGTPTFAKWARERKGPSLSATHILLVTNHFIAVRGLDTWDTRAEGATVARFPHRRKQVHRVWTLEDSR